MAQGPDEILTVIQRIVAPLIAADGGKLYLVSADEEQVRLHLTGRFSGCPGNTLVARRFVEPAIHSVLPKAEITITSGILIPDGARLVESA